MQGKPTTRDALRLLMDGSQALARVEENGIRVDVSYLENTIKEVASRIKDLDRQLHHGEVYETWRRMFGDKTNLGSRDQLGKVLFEAMDFPCVDRTETGKPSTSASSLERVNLPFVKILLEAEKLKKAKSTYLEGILREVVDGYLHPSFNLHTVETFRSSSSNPNFQNIPIRDKWIGEIIRRCFIPRRGRVLVEVDFSGIEVRVACCYTKDPRLIEDFTQPGKDPHRDTAAQLFLMSVSLLKEHKDWAKKTVRDWAKNRFVFPQFYGSVFFQCAPHLWEAVCQDHVKVPGTDMTVQQYLATKGVTELGDPEDKDTKKGTFLHLVKEVERDFWDNRFKVYSQWKRDFWEAYLRNGYVDMLTGFRVQGVYKRNEILNSPIQGSSFHCLLWSLIQTQRELERDSWKTKMVGQIHDCELGDVPERELQDFLFLTRDIMSERLRREWDWIIVPMSVEAEIGKENWFLKKVWTEKDGVWGVAA